MHLYSEESPSINIKLVISYLGTPFVGWQKAKPTHKVRPVTPSIEEALELSLTTILKHPIKLQAASRTDAQVHAEGQVVNFFTQSPLKHCKSLDHLKWRLNSILPKTISVVSAEQAPLHFHPTLASLKKEYWYHVCNTPAQLPFFRHTSWHFPYPIDLHAMRAASRDLLGAHDFSAFSSGSNKNPICHLHEIEILELPYKRIRIALWGDRFLYLMARAICGSLAYAGCGKLNPSSLGGILKNKDRKSAGMTAPGHGLMLKKVFYDDFKK